MISTTTRSSAAENMRPTSSERSNESDTPRPVRILRITDLCHKTGMARSTLYGWSNPQDDYYDPTFPKKVRISAKAVGWLESEVDDWLQQRIDADRQ